MEGAHLVDVDVHEDALEDGEAEQEDGQQHRLPRKSADEGEDDQEERGRRKDESEHPVGLDRGAAENVEADKEELHDDAEEEEDCQPVEEHSRLRHAGILPPMAVVTQREFGLFIDGETVEPASGEVRELTEPATGAPLAKAAMAGEADVDRAVEAARAALEGPWGKTPPNERSRLLHALADAIVANRKELTELETRNVGKAVSSVKGEVAVSAENFRWYASAIASIAGRTTPIGGSILAYTLKEPVGVAAQIVPWNYPIMMAAWKLAPALAAGCTVVLKPDPATPLTVLRVAELAAEVGIPAGVVNIVPGDGPTTGSYLVQHPGVDKVAFTGSTATGSEIMRLCAEPVKRLSLELGGKSPNLVFADANLADAVPGDPLDAETQMGSLISQAHRDKVHGLVETGRKEGAEVITGGEPTDGDGAFYPPTVLAGVENRMAVAQEEIFGPVVTVIPFEDEAEAVRIANDVKYGLTATVWTSDPGRGHRLARQIKSGVIGINLPNTAFPGLPFGGHKQSGFGREGSLETIEMYLETKTVFVSTGGKPVNPWGL